MSGNAAIWTREGYAERERATEKAAACVKERLRGMIKDAVAELNEVLGEGYIFFTECQAGFYGLYVKQPVCEPYRQELFSANDVDGLAEAVVYLHSMIEGGVKV